ncbi:PAS domain S-box protein [Betaproteobacteria bacterium PRO7]|nr:PAS domain S-box protein [Betaproteobacteria bacterium PRO7]
MNVRDPSPAETASARRTGAAAADELARTRAMLDAVARVQGAFLIGADPREVFRRLLTEMLVIGESEYGFVGEVLYDGEHRPYLKTYAITDIAWDEATRRLYDGQAAAGIEFRNLDTLFGSALKTRMTVISNQPATDPRAGGLPHGHPPLSAFVGVPFLHDGAPVGLIGLANRAEGYSEAWLETMKPLLETACTLIVAHRARREREAMQLRLAQAAEENRKLALVASLTSNLVVVTDAQRRIEWVNAAFERVTGYALDEVRGRKPGEFLHGPDGDDAVLGEIRRRLERGEPVHGVEIRNYAKDGRPYWLLLEIQPVRDASGAVVQFIAIESDVTELRAARERAQAAERELREAIEALEDGFVLYDADDRLVLCNARYREIYRESADLIRPGMRFEDGLREGIRRGQYPQAAGREETWIAERLAAHCSAGSVIEQRLPDGRWLRIAERRTSDGGIVGFRVDITALKAATERAEAGARELHVQQAKFAAAFRNSADYLSIVRADDGRFVEVNDAFERMTGYARADVLGRTALELNLWGEPQRREGVLAEVFESGAARDVATLLRRKDGELRRVVAAAALIDIGGEQGVMWTVRDVTEQAAALEALRASEEKFAAAFRNSADHIVITRLADGVIVEVNDAFCRATGHAREDVLGKTTLELGAWAEPARREEARRLVVANGSLANFAFRQRRHDGSIMHCLLSATIVEIGGEKCILSAARDISERISAEEASKLLNKRLQATVAALEALNRRNAQLGEMRDLLHTCQTPSEVYKVAAHFVPQLLPQSSGALYLMDDGRVGLEAAFAWGESGLGESVFAPDACWSLRRGRSYRVADARQHLVCAHVHERPRGGYLCLPISAHGEANGVMHVQFEGLPEDDPLTNEAQEEFLRTMTEHIALALANARLRENLRIQASRDALTGLVNRRYMEETFEREIRRCARKDKPIAVFMVDVDHFKRFNDTHGHEAGDSVLRHVAATLTEVVRFEDIVCRYGGEEFLLVLPEADEAAALERAEQARARVERTVAHFREQALGGLSISIGVAMFPMHGERIDELIRAADAALYRAKSGGRNRVALHGADAAHR